MADKKILLFEQTTDKFVRKGRDTVRGDIVLSSEKKLTGTVERITYTLVKAIQDQVLSFTTQEELEDIARERKEAIYERYKESRKKRLYKLYEAKNTTSRNNIDIDKQVESKLAGEETLLNKISYREAWKNTLEENMQGKLDFYFSGNSILTNADVSISNKNKIWEDIKHMQNKFHVWKEDYFNEKMGRFEIKEVSAALFPYAEYLREGKGNDNIIGISLNPKMVHAILFLNSNFYKINREHLLAIKSGNGMRLYEILVDIANSAYEKEWHFDDLQRKFDTAYKDFFSFKKQLIDVNLKLINDKLGTSIKYRNMKDGRRIVAIVFVISLEDKAILKGFNRYTQDFDSEDLDVKSTLGYFIALKIYYKNPNQIKDLEKYSHKINNLIKEGKWDFADFNENKIRQEFIRNMEAISEIKELMSEYDDEIGEKVYFDDSLHVLVRSDTKIRLADNAIGSLAALYTEFLSKLGKEHPTLPGLFGDNTSIEPSTNDFLPFSFQPVPSMNITIKTENFEKFKNQIQEAANQQQFSSFKFDSRVKEEAFYKYFDVNINSEFVDVEVVELNQELVPESASSDEMRLLELFVSKHTSINPLFKEPSPLTDSLNNIKHIMALGYSVNDIVIAIDWLFSTKGDWFRPNVNSSAKLKEKFEYIFGHTKSIRDARSKLPKGMTIFDLYEQTDDDS